MDPWQIRVRGRCGGVRSRSSQVGHESERGTNLSGNEVVPVARTSRNWGELWLPGGLCAQWLLAGSWADAVGCERWIFCVCARDG